MKAQRPNPSLPGGTAARLGASALLLGALQAEASASPADDLGPGVDSTARHPDAQADRKKDGGGGGDKGSRKGKGKDKGQQPAPAPAPGGSPPPSAGPSSPGGNPPPSSGPSPGGSPDRGAPSGGSHLSPPAQGGSHGVGAPPSPGATPTVPRSTPADARAIPGERPQGYTRSYDRSARTPPPASSRPDHRYDRPAPHHVRPAPHAGHPPPGPGWYRPYYTRWYVHPYYRWTVATHVVVFFAFDVHPWVVAWAPPPRAGWTWMPGYWAPGGWWVPGYWVPLAPAPVYYPGVTYVYVPGWWQGGIYVDGYWRANERAGWTWVEGYYLADGNYVPGHWEPTTPGPEGYVWEPGFFDGEAWHEGFWRPQFRSNYTWVSAWFDEDGIYRAGYWKPTADRPGSVWVPGWFDGTQWVEGYWVTQAEYDAADPQTWTPPEGWDQGRGADASAPTGTDVEEQDVPLALPVTEEETTR